MTQIFTRRRIVAVAAIAASAALVLSGCSGQAGSSGGSGSAAPYKIGVILGLTGAYATVADPQKKALDLYEKNLTAAGGINGHPVEFVYVDSTSSESESVNQLRKLATQDNVIGVVGPNASGEAVALKPIAQSLKIPIIAIASNKAITDPVSSYVFKEFPTGTDAMVSQLEYLKAEGKKNIAILSSNNAYGQEPANALPDLAKQYGLNLVSSETFAPDATDLTTQLTVIQRSNPDVLLVWGVSPSTAIVAKNAKTIGFTPLVFQGTGGASANYLKLGGADANGTLIVGSKVMVDKDLPAGDPQTAPIQAFAKDWRAEYNTDPDQNAAGAWDAMLLMVTALEKGNIDPSNVTAGREALRTSMETNLTNVPGTVAVYSFSPTVHGPSGITGLAVIKVEDGKFSLADAAPK